MGVTVGQWMGDGEKERQWGGRDERDGQIVSHMRLSCAKKIEAHSLTLSLSRS